jgi:hypothetical protein
MSAEPMARALRVTGQQRQGGGSKTLTTKKDGYMTTLLLLGRVRRRCSCFLKPGMASSSPWGARFRWKAVVLCALALLLATLPAGSSRRRGVVMVALSDGNHADLLRLERDARPILEVFTSPTVTADTRALAERCTHRRCDATASAS